MSEDIKQVLFRDVLVYIKEKLMNRERPKAVIQYINAWIQTIDDTSEAAKKNK